MKNEIGYYNVPDEDLTKSFRPLDVVSYYDKPYCVGFIQEVNINRCQPPPHQLSYSVTWLTGGINKAAWFNYDELVYHTNLAIKIAENMCHPMGNYAKDVKKLFKSEWGL